MGPPPLRPLSLGVGWLLWSSREGVWLLLDLPLLLSPPLPSSLLQPGDGGRLRGADGAPALPPITAVFCSAIIHHVRMQTAVLQHSPCGGFTNQLSLLPSGLFGNICIWLLAHSFSLHLDSCAVYSTNVWLSRVLCVPQGPAYPSIRRQARSVSRSIRTSAFRSTPR